MYAAGFAISMVLGAVQAPSTRTSEPSICRSADPACAATALRRCREPGGLMADLRALWALPCLCADATLPAAAERKGRLVPRCFGLEHGAWCTIALPRPLPVCAFSGLLATLSP